MKGGVSHFIAVLFGDQRSIKVALVLCCWRLCQDVADVDAPGVFCHDWVNRNNNPVVLDVPLAQGHGTDFHPIGDVEVQPTGDVCTHGGFSKDFQLPVWVDEDIRLHVLTDRAGIRVGQADMERRAVGGRGDIAGDGD